jgi:hypothetical protein
MNRSVVSCAIESGAILEYHARRSGGRAAMASEGTRHYAKIAGLVPRTSRDLGPSAPGVRMRPRAFDFLNELRTPLPTAPRLVGTANGALEEILLTIPSYAAVEEGGAENPLAAVYRDLIAKLPRTAFVVLTHQSVCEDVRGWFAACGAADRATLIPAPDHINFSVWAEDGYVVIRDAESSERYFVEPFDFPRYADALIADLVANATEMRTTQAPLYFQGGNVLVGDDFFMIGADYPANSVDYVGSVIAPSPGERPSDTIRRLYRSYLDSSREVIYVGSTVPVPAETEREIKVNGRRWREIVHYGNEPGTVQPLFHIDMFMTLAGRDDSGARRVLVGDPRAAAQILGRPVWPHAMTEVFDNIARGLERRGCRVIRNPLPLVHVDDPEERLRTWYFATANNALVELTDGASRIWIPTYGHGHWSALAATDDANERIWQELGFEVTRLGDFHPFAENLGAVHCIKKYLRRA